MGSKRSSSFLFLILVLLIHGDHHCTVGLGLGGASASALAFFVDKNANESCNATIGTCFYSNNEYEGGEFLGHYAAGGRWLLQTGSKISYGALQRPSVCSTAQYSNCIVPTNNMNRPCTAYNRCKRG